MDARCIRIKKIADTNISGYVWTGPKEGINTMTTFFFDTVLTGSEDLCENFLHTSLRLGRL